jgi:putative MATE family efflux protein
MKDLTRGSIARHVVRMSASLVLGMVFQTLYYLVDLYFVAHLSGTAVAGVSAAGTAMFVIFSATQVLGVGTLASMSHAVGAKNQAEANLVLNQSLALSALGGMFALVCGYLLAQRYMEWMAADAVTAAAGTTFLHWTMPGVAMQFPLVALGSSLRGAGVVRTPVIVQSVAIVVNILLAPILIAGWGTHHAMGVAGAGLASAIAMTLAVLLLWVYVRWWEKYLSLDRTLWRPRWRTWRRFLEIGLPAGGEFVMSFLLVAVTYYCLRNFGAAAQAAAGVGGRILQAIFMPAMAIAYAAGPIAGQNFGARNATRVRETFRDAALISATLMAVAIPLALWQPRLLVNLFTDDSAVRAFSTTYLQIMSWGFIAQALTSTCSSLFQGLGHTKPTLLIAAARVVTYAAPAVWLSTLANFRIEQLWYLSVFSVFIQAATSIALLRVEFRRRLTSAPAATIA